MTGQLAIADRAFAWQGKYELELVSRAVGDDRTLSDGVISIPVIIDSVAPAVHEAKVAWVDGVVHGVTAVGHGASHLVTLAEIMVRDRWTVKKAHEHIFAHPTLDEALRDALIAPQEEK